MLPLCAHLPVKACGVVQSVGLSNADLNWLAVTQLIKYKCTKWQREYLYSHIQQQWSCVQNGIKSFTHGIYSSGVV